MSKSISSLIAKLGGGALLSLAAALPAAADDGFNLYRCRVLGDSSACTAPSPALDTKVTRLVPGPYAAYLMYQGQSLEHAVANARSIGEEPTLRIVEVATPAQVSGFEAYERLQGRTPSFGYRTGSTANVSAVH